MGCQHRARLNTGSDRRHVGRLCAFGPKSRAAPGVLLVVPGVTDRRHSPVIRSVSFERGEANV